MTENQVDITNLSDEELDDIVGGTFHVDSKCVI
ncbi:hypothetical protein EDD90_2985 [Streptomyces sp. Ag109_O5-1]|nr:hypothetical protein EDD90_2985 [Streptomyces sp. Ag109_O5-1]